MTLRNLRNIHPTRNSCRDTLPCVIWHLNYLSFLPLTEIPLIATLKFGILTISSQSATKNHFFLNPQRDRSPLRRPRRRRLLWKQNLTLSSKNNVCILCAYIYTPHFFYLSSIYIYIYNTKFASPCLYLTCCNCCYVCLLLCLFISSFLNLIYFIILYIYYYYFAFNFYCSFITFLHFLY